MVFPQSLLLRLPVHSCPSTREARLIWSGRRPRKPSKTAIPLRNALARPERLAVSSIAARSRWRGSRVEALAFAWNAASRPAYVSLRAKIPQGPFESGFRRGPVSVGPRSSRRKQEARQPAWQSVGKHDDLVLGPNGTCCGGPSPAIALPPRWRGSSYPTRGAGIFSAARLGFSV